MSSNQNPDIRAISALLYAATLWGVFWYPMRLLDEVGMDGLWATAVSFGAASVFGLFRVQRSEWLCSPVALWSMALATGWCNLAFVIAILDGPVVRAILLFYLSPIWSVLLGYLFLGERVGRRSLVVLVVALIGAGIMLWSSETGSPWPATRSDWFALSSGVAFSISNVLVRKLQHITVFAKTSASWVGALVVSLVGIVVVDDPLPDVPSHIWVSAGTLGLICLTTMTLAVQYGVTRLPLHRSAVILLFELVAGTVSSILLANELLSVREVVGGGLIILAAWWSSRR